MFKRWEDGRRERRCEGFGPEMGRERAAFCRNREAAEQRGEAEGLSGRAGRRDGSQVLIRLSIASQIELRVAACPRSIPQKVVRQ